MADATATDSDRDGPEPDGDASRRPGPPTWTVRELSASIGAAVRDAFPAEVWVRGEIHDLSRARSGHVYFTLREVDAESAEQAQLSVMLPATARERVNRLLTRAGGRVRMTDGTEVRIRGWIDFYEARGQLQLRMTSIDPAFTLGQLAAARAALIDKLRGERLLDANASRTMPLAPLRLGLVTAAGSAAEADTLHELTASGFRFEVLAADVRVQGPEAPQEIAAAITGLARRGLDLVIVVRGGGAASDLAAFDTELVARAIASCPVPVVTGIGHETDRSVADEVAHTAAKTPTAAARHVVSLVAIALERAETAWRSISVRARHRLDLHGDHLERCRQRARRGAITGTARADEQLLHAGDRLGRAATGTIEAGARSLEWTTRRLLSSSDRAVTRGQDRIALISARIGAVDPARALERGWSITRRTDGTLVRSVADAGPGTALLTTLADGTLVSVVESHTPEEP